MIEKYKEALELVFITCFVASLCVGMFCICLHMIYDLVNQASH